MNTCSRRFACSLGLTLGLSATHSAFAADPAPLTPKLPAWVVEASVSGRAYFDNNIYGVDNERAGFPVAEQDALVTILSARFAFSVTALNKLPKEGLVLGYAPTISLFSRYSEENNINHKFSLQSSGKKENLSWNIDQVGTYIDGSRESLRFNNYSAYGIAMPRERRTQWQDTLKASLRYNWGELFARAAGSLLYYDLMTKHANPTGTYAGWINYIDRYDINGGLDLGYKLDKTNTLFLGWRHGYQYQQAFPWTSGLRYNCNSHYDRLLVGIEGKPAAWLALSVTAGPDFRDYSAPDSSRGIVDASPTALFLESNATITLGKADSVALVARQWRWVSSTGRTAYDDANWSVTWKHSFNKEVSFQLLGQRQNSDYSVYPTAVSAVPREDTLYTLTPQITWTPHKQLSVTVDYTWQKGQNEVDHLSAVGREYDRYVIGATVKLTF